MIESISVVSSSNRKNAKGQVVRRRSVVVANGDTFCRVQEANGGFYWVDSSGTRVPKHARRGQVSMYELEKEFQKLK